MVAATAPSICILLSQVAAVSKRNCMNWLTIKVASRGVEAPASAMTPTPIPTRWRFRADGRSRRGEATIEVEKNAAGQSRFTTCKTTAGISPFNLLKSSIPMSARLQGGRSNCGAWPTMKGASYGVGAPGSATTLTPIPTQWRFRADGRSRRGERTTGVERNAAGQSRFTTCKTTVGISPFNLLKSSIPMSARRSATPTPTR